MKQLNVNVVLMADRLSDKPVAQEAQDAVDAVNAALSSAGLNGCPQIRMGDAGKSYMLRRLVEKVERANALQHSRRSHTIPAEDWAELNQLCQEARAELDAGAAAEEGEEEDCPTLYLATVAFVLDGDVYGTEEYAVEAKSKREADAAARSKAEGSRYHDHRLDFSLRVNLEAQSAKTECPSCGKMRNCLDDGTIPPGLECPRCGHVEPGGE